ncbi:M20 family metallo-hydrolase [Belliella sp. DSM 111904]|uniref:M20 family metallo-hydrolase n=1 Tax=Belliella filtrata TaxID=2923435 RepID=A0ABS9UW26_9BACT|nr:M20 family metallo-hydrolase [Belliella filtrata]MCH7408351.1 M20 family metallo-hydrolase [Belliella filtrata]
MPNSKAPYYEEVVSLLKSLISTPSYSKEEHLTADLIGQFLTKKDIPFQRIGNNIIAQNLHFEHSKPSILLNSHHDTVKPNAGYTRDPFAAEIQDEKLYGLGSNDAGGCLVSLLATFLHFYKLDLGYNLIYVASAEEEISGKNGIESTLSSLPSFELAIVGEPTLLQGAVAEKGLVVVDAIVTGKAGHAAREEGINALYEALDDLNLLRSYQFERESEYLGKSKVSATIIQSGTQHNVVPDRCTYTLDIRVTDAYTLDEALEELTNKLKAKLTPRSTRLKSSRLPHDHKMMKVLTKLNINQYGSPTLSDQALIPYPSIKIGPGDSARSHTADEYIYLKEINEGINTYIELLTQYFHIENPKNQR